MLPVTPDKTQIKITRHLTRNCVTTASYLKCNWRARKRSAPIAITVLKDAMPKMWPNMAASKSTIAILQNDMDAIRKGWLIKPTAKSDTARLDSKIFDAECKEDVFQIVIKIKLFPNSAVKVKIALITQTAILKCRSFSKCPSQGFFQSELLNGRVKFISMIFYSGLALKAHPIKQMKLELLYFRQCLEYYIYLFFELTFIYYFFHYHKERYFNDSRENMTERKKIIKFC